MMLDLSSVTVPWLVVTTIGFPNGDDIMRTCFLQCNILNSLYIMAQYKWQNNARSGATTNLKLRSDLELMDTLYLTFTGELWGGFHEYFGDEWLIHWKCTSLAFCTERSLIWLAGSCLSIKMLSYQFPILKIRQLWDRLIINMGIPIHWKDGLYIETGPS